MCTSLVGSQNMSQSLCCWLMYLLVLYVQAVSVWVLPITVDEVPECFQAAILYGHMHACIAKPILAVHLGKDKSG